MTAAVQLLLIVGGHKAHRRLDSRARHEGREVALLPGDRASAGGVRVSARRISLRYVDFVGEKSYAQGHGMTWDDLDIVVDLREGEEISFVATGSRPGGGFDGSVPTARVWITAKEPA